MQRVSGLQSALNQYDSSKVKERAQGAASLREIFSNRENLETFQETAARDGGAGWIAFFQCLFQVTVNEKKAYLKPNSTATTERRLADAVDLVRRMAEKSVHYLSRKPFMTLFTHMTTMLVDRGRIFEPVAIDYAKALRTLLSYPPHLEHLDHRSWRKLMGICWAAVLGDRIALDEDFTDALDEDEESAQANGSGRYALPTYVTTEVLALIPILLGSANAPLVPRPSELNEESDSPAVGMTVLLKIHRYLSSAPSFVPPEILRSLNIVLGEMELNCREHMVAAGTQLFPELVNLWSLKNKGDLGLREHVLIAMRTLMPFVTQTKHTELSGRQSTGAIVGSMVKVLDNVGREAGSRSAIKPLDLETLRFSKNAADPTARGPFELMSLSAGLGFDASSAFNWVALELLADCCFHTYDVIHVPSSTVTQTQSSRKRQRTESTLDRLLDLTLGGPIAGRLLACQAVVVFLDKYWNKMSFEAKDAIRKRLLDILDDESADMQSWALIGLASLAFMDDKADEDLRRIPVTPAALASRRSQLQTSWERLWAHAVRKTSVSGVSRAACHAAEVVLRTGKVDLARCLRDIQSLLRNADIQGPPTVSETACTFFVESLAHIRADAGLYSANLENKVLDWFSKTFMADNSGRVRMATDQATPIIHLRLMSSLSKYNTADLNGNSDVQQLPDCPTVNRVLYEGRTAPIREVVLYGSMPPPPNGPAGISQSAAVAAPPVDSDSLAFLDGLPRKLCDVLRYTLEAAIMEWTQNDRPMLVSAQRLRKSVDLVVLVLLFQATIQANGSRPDVPGCLLPAAKLLSALLPHIRNLSEQDVSNQLLVWHGFTPLFAVNPTRPTLWPVLLKPDVSSGIRRDLLPVTKYASYYADDTEEPRPALKALAIVWTAEETSEALADLVELAKSWLPAVRSTNIVGATAFFDTNDDDDFGPIVSADHDSMPQSLEAKAAHRSTSALLKVLVDIRLRGPMFTTSDGRPTKDVALVNTLITSEGPQFAELGHVVCDAISEGSMRLTVDVVDVVLAEISDRIVAYAYKRDPELLRLAAEFLTRTIPIWLSPESGLADRALDLAKALIHLSNAGNMASWQCRLQLLVFIDEYLDYDPGHSSWLQMSDTDEADVIMGGDHDELGPLRYLLSATADVDSRVRYRAASSAAAVHYLPDEPTQRKAWMYTDVVERQSTIEYSWDHFLTNLVWKLNTCIASAHLRATTIFHLYEVADGNTDFLTHLQNGLEAVSRRLGLDSLQTLYRAHAPLVVEAQLECDQLPMRVPPPLYGCTSHKDFAAVCLQAVGSKLLSTGKAKMLSFFTALCDAASVPEDQARMRYLPAAAAIAVVIAVADSPDASDGTVVDQVAGHAMSTLPQPASVGLETFLAGKAEYIVTRLIATVDLTNSNEDVARLLDTFGTTAADLFARLTAYDSDDRDAPPVLDPAASALDVLQALSFFREIFESMSRRRMVFEALIKLFYAVNNSYLVNEQRRYLRALAILTAIYSTDLQHAMTLQLYLRNTLELLVLDDIGNIAMSMLEWGFDRLAAIEQPPMEISDIMISLGSAYAQVIARPSLKNVAERMDVWVASKAQSWSLNDTIYPSLPAALTFWPKHWAEHFHLAPPLFGDVAEIAEQPRIRDPLALSQRLLASVKGDKAAGRALDMRDTFLSSTFWHLKKALTAVHWNHDGAMAFLDLLNLVDGQVQAPSLKAIGGLTGRTRLLDVSRMYSGKPEWAVRVAVLDKIVQQTASDDYRLRTTAFEVLQTTFPLIKAMGDKGLPSYLHDLIVFLVPATLAPAAQSSKIEVLEDESSGWVTKSRSHELWARELSLLLSALAAQEDEFYSCLQPLLGSKGSAAVELLPFLVQAVLTSGAEDHPDVTAARAAALSSYFTQVLQFPTASMQTVDAIIQIILHLRHFSPPYGSGELAYDQWLNIDRLVLSEAAGRCGAFASSLLFLEMADDRDEGQQASVQLSNPRVQKVMYDIYSNVEDPDGFYGIQNTNVMDSLHRRLDHEAQPLRSLGYNLAANEATHAPSASSGPLIAALRNLHDLGFDNLAGSVAKSLKSVGGAQSTSDPFFLELAWRMGDWDVPLSSELANTSSGRFYAALRAVHRERSSEAARAVVDLSIKNEMAYLQQIGVERMTAIQKAATNLLCLRDVARWISQPMQAAIDQGDFDGGLLSRFVVLDRSMDFTNAERLSATRLSLIRSARARESKNLLGDLVSTQSEGLVKLEISSQLRLSELARKEGNLQAAVNAITAVRQLEERVSPSDAAQDEFSQVLWAQGEHALAIQHVRMISESGDARKNLSTSRQAVLLGRTANWTALAKLRSAEEIRRTFRKAMDMATNKASPAPATEQARLAYEFAVFTDRYYVTLSRSPELERLKSFVSRKKTEYDRIEKERSKSATPQSRRYTMDKAQEELEEERTAKEALEQELLRYLNYTLQSYAAALRLGDEHDDAITRLVSIWLEHDTNEDANKAFAQNLSLIPSHKFLPLGPQLAARLYRPKVQTTFNSLLNRLMLRIGQDHPYHVLYQIITLAHGVDPPHAASSRHAFVEGREVAAAEMMAIIKADKARPLAAAAGTNMTYFAEAAVKWCHFEYAKGEQPAIGKEAPLPSRSTLVQCRGLRVPIATSPPAVDLQLKYDNVPTIDRYRSRYKLAGGVHHPSIMTCVDSLGQEHVQLFKGQDEVRQDAVMQQVFEMSNRLLTRDRKANQRKLHFRTYVVIPLALQSGIIEFVGNTSAIGDWLKPAHIRYRKNFDVSPDIFRKNIDKLQKKDWTSPKIVSVWEQQMGSFQPVMRHFFTEKRREPLAWFTMRLNYARSVAVTSMVGHMVGLGDRHCSNILIDRGTGELVHIDFGIAFEEGRKLRIPEKVPFRLTNDIVDGLGITGVEGTFRQCAEHTLRVLRDSSELILTVLEVFKHDPLYAWGGDEGKMSRAQGGGRVETSSGQDKAERILARIRQKLGHELSVEYSVNQLIQEARDPEHLAKIFVGWQSWL